MSDMYTASATNPRQEDASPDQRGPVLKHT